MSTAIEERVNDKDRLRGRINRYLEDHPHLSDEMRSAIDKIKGKLDTPGLSNKEINALSFDFNNELAHTKQILHDRVAKATPKKKQDKISKALEQHFAQAEQSKQKSISAVKALSPAYKDGVLRQEANAAIRKIEDLDLRNVSDKKVDAAVAQLVQETEAFLKKIAEDEEKKKKEEQQARKDSESSSGPREIPKEEVTPIQTLVQAIENNNKANAEKGNTTLSSTPSEAAQTNNPLMAFKAQQEQWKNQEQEPKENTNETQSSAKSTQKAKKIADNHGRIRERVHAISRGGLMNRVHENKPMRALANWRQAKKTGFSPGSNRPLRDTMPSKTGTHPIPKGAAVNTFLTALKKNNPTPPNNPLMTFKTQSEQWRNQTPPAAKPSLPAPALPKHAGIIALLRVLKIIKAARLKNPSRFRKKAPTTQKPSFLGSFFRKRIPFFAGTTIITSEEDGGYAEYGVNTYDRRAAQGPNVETEMGRTGGTTSLADEESTESKLPGDGDGGGGEGGQNSFGDSARRAARLANRAKKAHGALRKGFNLARRIRQAQLAARAAQAAISVGTFLVSNPIGWAVLVIIAVALVILLIFAVLDGSQKNTAPDPCNGQATVQETLDIKLTGPETATIAAPDLTYDITITDTQNATEIPIVYHLPEGVSFDPATISSSWPGFTPPDPNEAQKTITWKATPENLPPGGSLTPPNLTFNLKLKIKAGVDNVHLINRIDATNPSAVPGGQAPGGAAPVVAAPSGSVAPVGVAPPGDAAPGAAPVGSADAEAKWQEVLKIGERHGPAWIEFLNDARIVASEEDYPVSVIIAQGALESGHGTSNISKTKKNFFGYKAYDNNTDAASTYPTAADSIRDYVKLIKGGNGGKIQAYKDAYASRADPRKMVELIKAGGYATDEMYITKVTGIREFEILAGIALPGCNSTPNTGNPPPIQVYREDVNTRKVGYRDDIYTF